MARWDGRRRTRTRLASLGRAIRFRFLVPLLRSRHPPEYTARGVANGVFWGLTPSVGFQYGAIVGTWLVTKRVLQRDSSLVQALIWSWINNPLTMIPLYYGFYVTGLWMMGTAGPFGGYDAFAALWGQDGEAGWIERLLRLLRTAGVPLAVGCLPYATLGGALSYRWAVVIVRRRHRRMGIED